MTHSLSQMVCPVCEGSDNSSIAHIENIPVFCNFLYPSTGEAQGAAKGEIELVLCNHCSHMYNSAFNQDIVTYRPGYENSLHYSVRYQEYASQQVKRLLNRYNLHGQRIVDIGCGKGEFLELFSSMGDCMGTGFEPAAPSGVSGAIEGGQIIAEPFSETYFDIPAKCYVSRHVLEHLSDPADLLKTVRLAMEDEKAVLFLEVPDGAYMLEQCSVWDLIYEHYSYFTPQSLQYLLRRTGFCCTETLTGFGGQYLFVDAFPSTGENKMDVPLSEEANSNGIARLGEKFSLCLQTQNKKVENLLQKQLALGKKSILWGAGSKGIALLNQLPEQEGIQYVVDINPEKQGKFIPGSGQLVVPPEFLVSFQPDTVLIMNSMYKNEIQRYLDALNISTQIQIL
jgi:Methyltransferase domain/C-methyltransferase C-terminal domain